MFVGDELAQGRFDRDWLHILDDRKDRTWDEQPDERTDRRYVPHIDPAHDAYSDLYEDEY